MAWGGALREQSLEKIQSSEYVRGISLIAVGQKEQGEFAHTHWGVIPKEQELADILGWQADLIDDNDHTAPDWQDEFNGSYEELKERACQQDLGLLAVMHSRNGNGNEAETAAFGLSPESAVLALNTVSERLSERSGGILIPSAQTEELQQAA